MKLINIAALIAVAGAISSVNQRIPSDDIGVEEHLENGWAWNGRWKKMRDELPSRLQKLLGEEVPATQQRAIELIYRNKRIKMPDYKAIASALGWADADLEHFYLDPSRSTEHMAMKRGTKSKNSKRAKFDAPNLLKF